MTIKTKEEHLRELQKKAEIRGGKLISNIYINTNTKYEFEDVNGNRFFMAGSSVKSGKWCREGLVTEPLCRQVIEHIFKEKFPSTFTVLNKELLKRKRPLELDGYCDKLKIAFEYQGRKCHWFKDDPQYKQTVLRDKLKKKFCKKIGIHLIIIPPIKEQANKWSSENMFLHVLKAVKNSYKNLECPKLNMEIFIADLSKNNHAFKKINELKEIAHLNRGKLISTVWKGARDMHIFEFEDGREFQIKPTALKRNGWPKDADFFLKSSDDRYNELKDIVEENGAILLETKWNGSEQRHKIRLKCGTIIGIIPESIRKNGWVKAPHKYLTNEKKLANLKKLALENNGKILEDKWLGVDNKHKLQLASGLICYLTPTRIANKGWPKKNYKCPNSDMQNLKILQDIALTNNGYLLSTEWNTWNSKYLFKFKDGRIFEIIGQKLKSRGWPQNPDYYFNQMKTGEDRLKELKQIALLNNGELISDTWLNSTYKYEFKFEDGRIFKRCYGSMVNYGWPKNSDEYFKRAKSKIKNKGTKYE